MNSIKCPECSGDLIQDPVDKVIACIRCGLILKREKYVRIPAHISLEKDRKTIIKIKNTISSIDRKSVV